MNRLKLELKFVLTIIVCRTTGPIQFFTKKLSKYDLCKTCEHKSLNSAALVIDVNSKNDSDNEYCEKYCPPSVISMLLVKV